MKNHLYDIFEKWGTNIWIISDPHFDDTESWNMRFPYACDDPRGPDCAHCHGTMNNCPRSPMHVDEFSDILVRRINRKVGKKGTIIILGDIGNIEKVKKIKGYKVLLLGNHDKGASNYKRVVKVKEFINGETGAVISREFISDNHLFDEVYEGPLMINDRVILSHEPIPVPEYMFNIHGHVHNEHAKGDEHHLNVICECVDYEPVSLSRLLKEGLTKNIESIHRETIDKATERKAKKNAVCVEE